VLDLSPEDKLTVQVAGLLHDVGHSAFSHAVEAVLKRNPEFRPEPGGRQMDRHEAFTSYIITTYVPRTGDISGLAEKETGLDPQSYFERVALVATGQAEKLDSPYLAQLISGDIDADRIDFLLRDSYHTGISLGLIDPDRILQSLSIKNGEIVLGSGDSSYGEDMALTAAESMLIARAHHYNAIIHHPHLQSARTMLLRALEDALSAMAEKEGEEAVRETVERFFVLFKDADLIDYIRTWGSAEARHLLGLLAEGRIYEPFLRFNQKTLSPSTKMALSTIARHGKACRMFENELEKRLGDVFVDLSVASGVPKSTRISAGGAESFFYDESALAGGLVRAISRQLFLTAFAPPDVADSRNVEEARLLMKAKVEELSARLLAFVRQDQYLPIEGLILLFYGVYSIFEKEEDNFISVPRIRNITWVYRTVKNFNGNSRLQYLFDYAFHEKFGFSYSNRVYEDLQVLVAMGIVDEDLRYYEKAGRYRQRYEYVLTEHGVKYGEKLTEAYSREFREITEMLKMDKHSIPRDMVTIPRTRFLRETGRRPGP
jgi:HD superfamily phosphohydrolase